MDDVNNSQTEHSLDVTVPDTEYPQELLGAHYMDGAKVHHPFEAVLHGLEILLYEKGVFQEINPRETPDPARWRILSDYIECRSQEALYQEMWAHDDPVVSSAATHIDPEWKPRTEHTFESSDSPPRSDIITSMSLNNFGDESAGGWANPHQLLVGGVFYPSEGGRSPRWQIPIRLASH